MILRKQGITHRLMCLAKRCDYPINFVFTRPFSAFPLCVDGFLRTLLTTKENMYFPPGHAWLSNAMPTPPAVSGPNTAILKV
jgi:hypothetical protein